MHCETIQSVFGHLLANSFKKTSATSS